MTRIVELAKPDELPAIAQLSQRCRNEIRVRRGSHFYGDRVMLLDAIKRDDRGYISVHCDIEYKDDYGLMDEEEGKWGYLQHSPSERIKSYSTLYFAHPGVKNLYLSHRIIYGRESQIIESMITNTVEDYGTLMYLSVWTFEMGYYSSDETLKAVVERMPNCNMSNVDPSDFIKGVIASGRAYQLRMQFIPQGAAYMAGYRKFLGLDLFKHVESMRMRGRDISIKNKCGRDVVLNMLASDPGALIRCTNSMLPRLFDMTDDKLARRMLGSQIRRLAPILDLANLVSYLKEKNIEYLIE
jgi:hypothetical protein